MKTKTKSLSFNSLLDILITLRIEGYQLYTSNKDPVSRMAAEKEIFGRCGKYYSDVDNMITSEIRTLLVKPDSIYTKRFFELYEAKRK